ncbi:unnamed protein product [Cylicocyclus nassatus]|uniref:Uncharacterized protein n=1 Tax=Cylicocyclus nassatus TaxID=53992 RepID=A0AA36GZN5_CYLNA|nr:unnamed protein product [Cylicocyclus nassatus]
MKLHFPKSGEDTQVFCQNMRSLLLSIAGFVVLFFHHPALFNINSFACGVWFYIGTTCYSLGIGFFALESLNVHEVVYGHARKSHFWDRENKAPYKAPPIVIYSVAVGIVLGLCVATPTITYTNKVVTSWTCTGHFSKENLSMWLAIVIFDTCVALTATSLAYESYFTLTNVPQYRCKTTSYWKERGLYAKSCIEKCYRDVAFVALGPWLLLIMWLTLAISFDWVSVSFVNITTLVASLLYTASNFLQSACTNPDTYSKCTRLAMRLLPQKIVPHCDPVTMWSRSEVLDFKKSKETFIPYLIKDQLQTY